MNLRCVLLVVLSVLLNPQLVHSAEIVTKCTIVAHICFLKDDITVNDDDSLKIIVSNAESISKLSIHQNLITFGIDDIGGTIKFDSIPYGIFGNFPRLQFVEMIEIGIKSLESDRFLNAKFFEELTISNNNIQLVPRNIFANNPKLSKINLRGNRIETIEDNAFAGLDYLSILRLDQNLIRSLGRLAFAGAPHIRNLELADNRIEIIEDLNLSGLEHLNLNGNKLKIVPDMALVAPDLTSLFLNGNPIEDANFVALANLEKLQLLYMSDLQSELKFTSDIPQHLPTKSKLSKIVLNNSALSSSDIFKHLSVFGKLEIIFASNNSFTDLNDVEQIRNYFPQLKEINFEKNEPPLCDWIKINQQWLNGVKVWSGTFKFFHPSQDICGSTDFTIYWYINRYRRITAS